METEGKGERGEHDNIAIGAVEGKVKKRKPGEAGGISDEEREWVRE